MPLLWDRGTIGDSEYMPHLEFWTSSAAQPGDAASQEDFHCLVPMAPVKSMEVPQAVDCQHSPAPPAFTEGAGRTLFGGKWSPLSAHSVM